MWLFSENGLPFGLYCNQKWIKILLSDSSLTATSHLKQFPLDRTADGFLYYWIPNLLIIKRVGKTLFIYILNPIIFTYAHQMNAGFIPTERNNNLLIIFLSMIKGYENKDSLELKTIGFQGECCNRVHK